MKKIKSLLAISICLISLACFTGCGKNKTAISADEFCEKLENKGYLIEDSTSQYDSYEQINESYIALSDDYEYQIEFIVLDSESDASSMYSYNKEKFELAKEDSDIQSHSEVNLANYSKYELSVNGTYKILSRIDNTLIYIDTNSEFKEEIKEILDDLGY